MSKTRCYEVIHQEWRNRLNEFRKLIEGNSDKQQGFFEGILSRDETRLIKFCLSFGGPADYLELEVNNDNEIIGATYLYQDWFDFARRTIIDHELKIVKELFEPFI